MMNGRKCLICETSPRFDGSPYCRPCQQELVQANSKRKATEPVKFLVYQGSVVGLFPNGKTTEDGQQQFSPALLKRDPTKLPKGKTLVLDTYIEGYTRDQIKKLKAAHRQAVACRIGNQRGTALTVKEGALR